MSFGLTSKKLVTYRSLPSASFPNLASVMIELCGSVGSISPNARPARLSYGIVCPVPVTSAFLSTMIRVIFAWAAGAQVSSAAAAVPMASADLRQIFGDVRSHGMSPLWVGDRAWAPGSPPARRAYAVAASRVKGR